MMENKDVIQIAEEAVLHTYNRYPLVLDRGEGVYLYDINEKKYLDFGAGIAVNSLGYSNQEYKQALTGQIDKLIHISNLYYTAPAAKAAKTLAAAAGMDKVFFTNSGTEAIEGAIKAAKKYAYNKEKGRRYEIIAMEHSFHGRSIGALSVTGNEKYREPFLPLMDGVHFADFNDLESVKKLVNDNTCAILLEPIQGEGGIYPADPEFLKGLRKLCDEKDILLVFDEIQCGMGRTGEMFAWQKYGVEPDILVSAKALGCGVPVGAFMLNEKATKSSLVPGDHGTTYGGNPLAAAAVSAVFEQYQKLNILEQVKEISGYLEEKLDSLKGKYPFIAERRGTGLMQGLELKDKQSAEVIKKAMEEGLIVLPAGNNVIRLVPPLIIEKKHVDEMIEKLERAFE